MSVGARGNLHSWSVGPVAEADKSEIASAPENRREGIFSYSVPSDPDVGRVPSPGENPSSQGTGPTPPPSSAAVADGYSKNNTP